jgi:hypothetical protein
MKMPVPESYYSFVMDYAPYLYVTPNVGPDLTWGRAAFAAGFAVDFLYEAYFEPQFDDQSDVIEVKIVELSNWILTQQVTDSNKLAYGGFVSAENSQICYSVDAGRVIPALLKAYELTSNQAYLESAKLAAGFMRNMQQKPSILGVHDRYYVGFARALDTSNNWLPQMDVESLYNLIALGMLAESDPAHKRVYSSMVEDAVNFYRPGLEASALYFDPVPIGDGTWHRVGLSDDTIYDDSIAYALLGLYSYERYSGTVQKTYQAINAVGASPKYPAYNPGICWAGYINVKAKTLACDYYDAVSSGILGKIRMYHDKPAYDFSAQLIGKHAAEFMFWGPKHADYTPIENKQSMATVCWLGELFVSYQTPLTPFTRVLRSKGETLTLHQIIQTGEKPAYGESIDLKAIVLPQKTEETLIEPGYITADYLTLHLLAPIRRHDKITRNGLDYEVIAIQDFMLKDEVAFRKATLRRLLS